MAYDPLHPGARFGHWTIISQTSERRWGQRVFRCRCDCGTVRDVVAHSLVSGSSRSCGCVSASKNRLRAVDLTGRRYGRMVVVGPESNGRWRCLCDCGTSFSALGSIIRSNKVHSCGCLRRETSAKMEAQRLTGYIARRALCVDGTAVDQITDDRKLNSNSKTGVRGVSRMKNGTYRAYINLNHKQIGLGCYITIEEAMAARKQGEKEYYKPILERHPFTRKSK